MYFGFTPSEFITLGLAGYGAIVSTLAIVLALYDLLRDKGRVLLSAYVANMVVQGVSANQQPTGKYLFVSAVNAGRRPVLIQGLLATKAGQRFRCRDKKEGFWFKSENFANAVLEEARVVTDHFLIDREMITQFKSMSGLGVNDSTGRCFTMSSGAFQKLRDSMVALSSAGEVKDVRAN